MRASLLLSSAALAAALLLTGSRATAQVDSTDQTKPELNALPPDEPIALPPGNPKQQGQDATLETTPAAPGTFQPARPAQPAAVPAPARRPVPTDAGTPVIVKPERARSKWFVTGNPDLGFSAANGNSYFSAGLSALLGYRLTERFAIGPGLTYQYTSISGHSFSNVGARLFAQALITDNIFVHAEAEALRTPEVDRAGYVNLNRRITVNSQFAGLGYRQAMGERAAFDIVVLYNFSYAQNFFVYYQPEFRFDFLFDLF